MKIAELLNEDVSIRDLNWLENLADHLFHELGIDVTFTKHFFDRVNDDRKDYRDNNNNQHSQNITTQELADMFLAAYTNAKDINFKKTKITDIKPGREATLRDIFTKLNIPFVIKSGKSRNDYKELLPKTVMRKDNFFNPPGVHQVTVNTKMIGK